jgi:hypothetical protein
MVRLLLGLLKGAVIGAGVGYGAEQLGLGGGWGYLIYGAVGFLVGLLVGRPFWSHLLDKDPDATVWTSVVKGIVGVGIGVGLYALVSKVLPEPVITMAGDARSLTDWPFIFGGLVGALYGAFTELDDTPRPKRDETASK